MLARTMRVGLAPPLTLLALLASPTSRGQDCRDADKTVKEVYDCFYEVAAKKETTESTKNASKATSAPDAFATRLHSSYQDFLNALSFAVNGVEESEDGQALIVRFNPLRQGTSLLGVTLTAAKPQLAESLTEAIPEDRRAAAVEALDDELAETDDLTLAASYSFQTSGCQFGSSRWSCWGRGPDIYRDRLSELIDLEIEDDDPALMIALSELVNRFDLPFGDLFPRTVDSLSVDQDQFFDLIKRLAAGDAGGTATARQRDRAAGFGNLATLIDNQPQVALTAAYRDTGPLVGPAERALSLELQFGKTNLNTLYRDCSDGSHCVKKKLAELASTPEALSTDKFVLTASYKWRADFNVASLDLPEELAADFPGLHVGDGEELKVRLQWGHQIESNLGRSLGGSFGLLAGSDHTSPEKARWDLALEGIRNSEDGIRTENRWVASWTLTYPLSDQVSIPLTVRYANKPEFLGEPREELGAHLGISYRFPWEN